MITFDLGGLIKDTPPWFRIPLLLLLFVVAGLLTGLCVILAIAVLQGRGVTAKLTGVEIAPKANACVTYGQNVSQSIAAGKDLLENLRGQIAEFSKQAGISGSFQYAAERKLGELLDKQDEIAKNREASLKKLAEVCEKSDR